MRTQQAESTEHRPRGESSPAADPLITTARSSTPWGPHPPITGIMLRSYRHLQRELQAGEVRTKGLRHPCRNIPAVRFVIDVAALPSTFPYVDKGQTAERVTDVRCEADN